MRITRRLAVAVFAAIILLLLFVLVAPALAQHTGGSFGGSAWGSRPSSQRVSARVPTTFSGVRLPVTPVRPRATAVTAPRQPTARSAFPVARVLWRAPQTQTRPAPRAVVPARPRVGSGGVAPVAGHPRSGSCDATPRRSPTQRDLEMASAFLFVFVVLTKLAK